MDPSMAIKTSTSRRMTRKRLLFGILLLPVLIYVCIIKKSAILVHTHSQQRNLEQLIMKHEPGATLNPLCAQVDLKLKGRENVTLSSYGFEEIEKRFGDVTDGGQWAPTVCTLPRRIAVIVPYRDRERHLKILLWNLIPKLQRQLVGFKIYIIEQDTYSRFNRGLLRNIGFVEASREDYDCYIFNDVDTITEDDRNLYTCYQGAALHMAVAVDTFKYKLLYPNLVGGIISMTKDIFQRINGYSNMYFMWGAEDDDLRRRLVQSAIPIKRPSVEKATVTTLKHQPSHRDRSRFTTFVNIGNYSHIDGLNNLKYEIISTTRNRLFTKIQVKINETYYKNELKKYKTTKRWIKLYKDGEKEMNSTMLKFLNSQIYDIKNVSKVYISVFVNFSTMIIL